MRKRKNLENHKKKIKKWRKWLEKTTDGEKYEKSKCYLFILWEFLQNQNRIIKIHIYNVLL